MAINFVWTLLCGFLVMFMQVGFAMLDTGFTRAKNASHTMAMNVLVCALGMLGYWVCGYAFQMGGLGGVLNNEFAVHLFGKDFGLIGGKGFFLSGMTYDTGIFVLLLFQMVLLNVGAAIPIGAMAERWDFKSFCFYAVIMGAFLYPVYANWVWGGGWLSQLGVDFGLGHGHLDFAGSSVVHMTGGVSALVGAWVLGPRIGKYNKNGSPNAIPGHH
ncbi:MAG: ammonium transporter, partial [Nitrospirota bacterium]